MTEASLTAVPVVEAQPKPPTNSIFRHAVYVVADNPVTGLSFGLFVLIAVCALIGPYIVPYDPLASDTSATLQSPSLHHWFGTDLLGRDIFSRVLAATAIEARAHAGRTPGALRTRPITFHDYDQSPIVASPLRALDCCLINDGAVAFLMTSIERARDLRQPVVAVAGIGTACAPVVGDSWFTQNPDYLTTPAAISGPKAFAMAGLEPRDIDFAELYDCFTINTILQFEELGFAGKGDGAAFALDKGQSLTDRLPTNTHGGLLSHSFSLGGSHIIEAVRQLRHQRGAAQVPGAELGLVTALGVPHHSTLILRRASR